MCCCRRRLVFLSRGHRFLMARWRDRRWRLIHPPTRYVFLKQTMTRFLTANGFDDSHSFVADVPNDRRNVRPAEQGQPAERGDLSLVLPGWCNARHLAQPRRHHVRGGAGKLKSRVDFRGKLAMAMDQSVLVTGAGSHRKPSRRSPATAARRAFLHYNSLAAWAGWRGCRLLSRAFGRSLATSPTRSVQEAMQCAAVFHPSP